MIHFKILLGINFCHTFCVKRFMQLIHIFVVCKMAKCKNVVHLTIKVETIKAPDLFSPKTCQNVTLA